MHPHVDADHNFYVQVRGTKRWTLYPTFLTPTMRPFPRIHPLWHKSQLHHNSPTNVAKPADMARFPAPLWSTEDFLPTLSSLVSTTNASVAASALGDDGVMVVDLSPGDVLYVPPYTWHSVESLTPSISLSSWSDNSNVRTLMQVRNYLFTDTVQSLAIQVDSCSHDKSKRMIIPMACSIFTEPNLTSSMPCGVDEAGYLPYALTWKRY